MKKNPGKTRRKTLWEKYAPGDFLDRLGMGAIFLDRDMRITGINTAAGDILQQPGEHFLDRSLAEALPVPLFEEFEKAAREAVKHGSA